VSLVLSVNLPVVRIVCYCECVVRIVCYCECVECLVMLFGHVYMADTGRRVARSGVFPQASLSRLGETRRNRPRFALELSLRR